MLHPKGVKIGYEATPENACTGLTMEKLVKYSNPMSKLHKIIFYSALFLVLVATIFESNSVKKQFLEKEGQISNLQKEITQLKNVEKLRDTDELFIQNELDGCRSSINGTVTYTYGIKLPSLEPEWHCSLSFNTSLNVSTKAIVCAIPGTSFDGFVYGKILEDDKRSIPSFQLLNFSIFLDKIEVRDENTKPVFTNLHFSSSKHIPYDFTKGSEGRYQFTFYSPNFLKSFWNTNQPNFFYGKYTIDFQTHGEINEKKLFSLAERIIEIYQPVYQISKEEIGELEGNKGN